MIALEAWKFATVDVVKVGGAEDTSEVDLEKANRVYQQIKIQLRRGRTITIGETESQKMIGDSLDVTINPKERATQETMRLTKSQNIKHITAYYVPGFSYKEKNDNAILRGLAICPSDYKSPPSPAVFVGPIHGPFTLAHEVGHILWDESGLGHHHDYWNLMYEHYESITLLPKITKGQSARMREHPLTHF